MSDDILAQIGGGECVTPFVNGIAVSMGASTRNGKPTTELAMVDGHAVMRYFSRELSFCWSYDERRFLNIFGPLTAGNSFGIRTAAEVSPQDIERAVQFLSTDEARRYFLALGLAKYRLVFDAVDSRSASEAPSATYYRFIGEHQVFDESVNMGVLWKDGDSPGVYRVVFSTLTTHLSSLDDKSFTEKIPREMKFSTQRDVYGAVCSKWVFDQVQKRKPSDERGKIIPAGGFTILSGKPKWLNPGFMHKANDSNLECEFSQSDITNEISFGYIFLIGYKEKNNEIPLANVFFDVNRGSVVSCHWLK